MSVSVHGRGEILLLRVYRWRIYYDKDCIAVPPPPRGDDVNDDSDGTRLNPLHADVGAPDDVITSLPASAEVVANSTFDPLPDYYSSIKVTRDRFEP